MKDRFVLGRTAYIEQDDRQHAVALGRWFRRVGRICLLGAAVAGGIDIIDAVRGDLVFTVTLRSLLDLSPPVTTSAFNPTQAIIEFVVGSPLWFVLMVIAAIPYALAIQRFAKEKPRR